MLLNINVDSGTPTTKIAPLLGLKARSLTRMLKSLEEREFVHRQPDEQDRKSVRIMLTDLGNKKRELVRKAVMALNKIIVEKVTAKNYGDIFRSNGSSSGNCG